MQTLLELQQLHTGNKGYSNNKWNINSRLIGKGNRWLSWNITRTTLCNTILATRKSNKWCNKTINRFQATAPLMVQKFGVLYFRGISPSKFGLRSPYWDRAFRHCKYRGGWSKTNNLIFWVTQLLPWLSWHEPVSFWRNSINKCTPQFQW